MLQPFLRRLLRIMENNIAELHRDTVIARILPGATGWFHRIRNRQLSAA